MRIALENKTFVGLGLEGCADVGDDLDEDVRLGEEEKKEKKEKKENIHHQSHTPKSDPRPLDNSYYTLCLQELVRECFDSW